MSRPLTASNAVAASSIFGGESAGSWRSHIGAGSAGRGSGDEGVPEVSTASWVATCPGARTAIAEITVITVRTRRTRLRKSAPEETSFPTDLFVECDPRRIGRQ